jgi:uncharacterized protein
VTPEPKDVTFYSDELKLAGTWYWPDRPDDGEDLPCVVFCQGYTGSRDRYFPDVVPWFVNAGLPCFLFDYRGFGDSEGTRGRLICDEQIRDIRAAFTVATSEPGIDPSRCAAFGISHGGSHALMAAARDERIAACVALMPIADGTGWLRSCRRECEYRAFRSEVFAERSRRVRTGESTWVSRHDILIPDPETEARFKRFPQHNTSLPLETAESLFDWRPIEHVAKVAPRPVLFIQGTDDVLVTPENALALYEAAGEPKELVMLQGATHWGTVYEQPEHVETVMTSARDFFVRVLIGT